MTSLRWAAAACAVFAVLECCAIGCGGSADTGSGGQGAGGGTGASSGTHHGTGTSAGGNGAGGSGTSSGGGGSGGAPPEVCPAPIMPVDTSGATNKVGSGTAGSCTEMALANAVSQGGAIVFNCGGPATITLTQQIEIPVGSTTTIDGGGVITIDGGGNTRLFHYDSPNFRANSNVITFQHLKLQNAKSTGTMLPQAPPPCSQGFDLDGGGAAIFVRDAVLHVIDVTFEGNQGATPGPDVAGGGVYGLGSLGVVIVGSTFRNNSASNGGAIGSLNTDLTLVDDRFDGNRALGSGANYIDPNCHVNGGESGDGGNGGAVVIDGGSDGTLTVCGSTFTNNACHALGGAMFRTPDGAMQTSNLDKCTFDGNSSDQDGGGALYFHNSALAITASTFSNNSAKGAGAIQADGTNLTLENDTFTKNSAMNGLGGAISIFSNGGSIKNCTFADNHADAGSGLFGAAIAGNQAFTVDNSIFSNNTSMDCGAPMQCQIQGSGQGDVQFPAQHIVCNNPDPPCGGAGGTTFADPKLGMLADNGGPTKTIVPAVDSPAASAGHGCPATDQRGHPRPADGCTAGAVELP